MAVVALSSAMSPYRITVTIAPKALLRAQDGVDLAATGVSFAESLRTAALREVAELQRGVASLEASVEVEGSSNAVTVEGPDELTCRRLEREVRDLIWVVRECVPFAVLG